MHSLPSGAPREAALGAPHGDTPQTRQERETRGRRSAKQDADPSGAVGAVKAYPGAHSTQTGCPAQPDRDGPAVLAMQTTLTRVRRRAPSYLE